jgi:hemolysin activation/secretion protein
LPVRGFESGDRTGTRAWTASLEYRLPLALVGRGVQLWPLFLDRSYVSSFLDAGNATCTPDQTQRTPVCASRNGTTLMSVGVEVGVDVALLSFSNTRLRIGVGQPLAGPRNSPRAYLTFGPAF